jgi:hypothetical protein
MGRSEGQQWMAHRPTQVTATLDFRLPQDLANPPVSEGCNPQLHFLRTFAPCFASAGCGAGVYVLKRFIKVSGAWSRAEEVSFSTGHCRVKAVCHFELSR